MAAFLLMVRNMLRNHPVNQESLLQCHGPPIIGAMLSKVAHDDYMAKNIVLSLHMKTFSHFHNLCKYLYHSTFKFLILVTTYVQELIYSIPDGTLLSY